MRTMIRPLVAGFAFAAIVAGGVTALTHSGETKEAGFVENACAKSAWPLIPESCLEGGHGPAVRVVGASDGNEQALAGPAMAERFRTDFE